MKALLALIALTTPFLAGTQQPAPAPKQAEEWLEAATYKVSDALRNEDPEVGAPGADAVGIWVGPFQGGMLIDRLDRKGLGVFVSIFSDKPSRGDLRVEFTDDSGIRHLVMPGASVGGACVLFQSPDLMKASQFTNIRVMYNANAKWLK